MIKYPIYEVHNFKCDSIHEDLYVNTFAQHVKGHAFVEKPHRHNSYLLLFFTHGTGTHEVDFDRFAIQPGSLFVLQPGQLHHWELSTDIDGFVVIYNADSYHLHFGNKSLIDYPFYGSPYSTPEIILDTAQVHSILPFFELMVTASAQMQRDKILNLLDCVHIEIAAYTKYDSHQTPIYNAKIKQFESMLELHFKSEKWPSFYANGLNITLKHLNRICNEILNKTATEVIAERVVLEIKRMLTDKQLSINEIGEALGFNDYSYFSRFFKKQTGTSPTDFRKTK